MPTINIKTSGYMTLSLLDIMCAFFYCLCIQKVSESQSIQFVIAFLMFQVPVIKPMELMVEASPRRIFANAHTYHINSISVNSDQETYLSADDLRINLWHLEITDQSFSILGYLLF